MKLEQSFDVAAPLEEVWKALIDVERVAPCLPGAEITGRNDDGSYEASFAVEIGPTSAAYRGRMHIEQVDEEGHVATMRAHGTDKRGQGGAKATIVSTLSPSAGGTKVDVVTEYSISGRLARFGRGGMIDEISNRLLREFAERLQATLAGAAPPARAAAVAGAPASATARGQDNGSEGEPSAVATAARHEASPRPDAAPRPKPPQVVTPAAVVPGGSTAPPRSEPVKAVPLLLSVLRDRLARAAPVLLAGVATVVLVLVLRRRR